jgi:hypothetical protein
MKPLWRLMRDELLRSTVLFVDETTAPVLDPGRGSTKTGYIWAIAQDQRSWGGTGPPAIVFTYAPGRGKDLESVDMFEITRRSSTCGFDLALRRAALNHRPVIMQSLVVRQHAGIPDDQVMMICVAAGWPDENFPANAVVSTRKSI